MRSLIQNKQKVSSVRRHFLKIRTVLFIIVDINQYVTDVSRKASVWIQNGDLKETTLNFQKKCLE
ncbi:MAG: hypothetical protein A2161_02720 [Candidatus Schekmanbacteria bacterium RBG_13_48_7]|uniref:Uncharacterized protein n=1 Tax=Candidatus Schekmanbacteria bacterium RBG_13_48_7 TaxID=1817878 RepID=A0A1F7S367_9BACT|nr:MAG: hypothetical protein A2161_02720 [Candidatus Schekmanbacteria bacterium RBG_13_48_7]